MRFAELEAVTVDGFGTLLELDEPVRRLQNALERHGISRPRDDVAAAFAAEIRHYKPRAHLGHDSGSLVLLRRECVQVFVEHLDVALDSARFVDAFVAALVFRPAAGAVETLRRLRARRVRLGVAANWDCSLPATLAQLGIAELFDTVVTSAEAGAAKPDPAILHLALERLGARPDRALHVGDEALDEQAARAAGMRFVPAPLASAFEGWT